MAVVDALLDLYGESNLRPSTAEIAERAGLSHRSLFRYFDDFDDLCREAICRAEQRARPLIPIEVDRAAPLTDRIEALVTQRLRLFEALGPVARVSRLNAPFADVLAAELTKNRAFLRAQLTDLFAPELNLAPRPVQPKNPIRPKGRPPPRTPPTAPAPAETGRSCRVRAGRRRRALLVRVLSPAEHRPGPIRRRYPHRSDLRSHGPARPPGRLATQHPDSALAPAKPRPDQVRQPRIPSLAPPYPRLARLIPG